MKGSYKPWDELWTETEMRNEFCRRDGRIDVASDTTVVRGAIVLKRAPSSIPEGVARVILRKDTRRVQGLVLQIRLCDELDDLNAKAKLRRHHHANLGSSAKWHRETYLASESVRVS